MHKILIVDDEKPARDFIAELVQCLYARNERLGNVGSRQQRRKTSLYGDCICPSRFRLCRERDSIGRYGIYIQAVASRKDSRNNPAVSATNQSGKLWTAVDYTN